MYISVLQYVYTPTFEANTDLSLTVNDKKLTIDSKLTPGIAPGLPNIDFTAIQGKSRVFLLLQVLWKFLIIYDFTEREKMWKKCFNHT